MKLLKQIIIPLIICGIASCQSQEDNPEINEEEISKKFETEITYPIAVNPMELQRVVKAFLKQNGRTLSRANELSITKIGDDENAFYVVNFLPDNGFVVISASKNASPILAYNTEGHYDVDGFPGASIIWKDETLDAIKYLNENPSNTTAMKFRHLWEFYEKSSLNSMISSRSEKPSDLDTEEQQALQKIYMDSLDRWRNDSNIKVYSLDDYKMGHEEGYNLLMEEIKESVYPPYQGAYKTISFIIERNTDHFYGSGNLIKTKWDQEGGKIFWDDDIYNKYFPATENRQHAYAGCGPVAAAQILYYHKFPVNYNWSSMELEKATDECARLLYDIAEMSNADYRDDGTWTNSIDIKNTIETMGYHACKDNFNINKIIKDLNNGRPILANSNLSNDSISGGHSWIIAGDKMTVSDVSTEVWTFRDYRRFTGNEIAFNQHTAGRFYYINWGWGGNGDGLYLDLYNALPMHDKYTNAKDKDMIYEIYPKQ